MRKASKRSRRQAADRSATVDVVSQLECAVRRPQATLIGALVGGIVPWFARTLAHDQLPTTWTSGNLGLATILIAVVLGCACFSAITVYKFGRATFGDKRKALGFVLAIEGVMLVSTGITSAVALAVLIAINALANGSSIALAREAICKKREAAARAATSRRHSRGANAPREAKPYIPQPPFPVVDEPSPMRHPRTNPVRWNSTVTNAEIVSERRLLA